MKIFVPVLLCIIFPISINAAEDSSADKPVYNVGNVYEFADGLATVKCRNWQVEKPDTDGNPVLKCGKYSAYFSIKNDYNLIRITDQEGKVFTEFNPFSPELSFPLHVGKKWNGSYSGYTRDNGNRWKSDVHCIVTKTEDVSVAAGTFKAFRIECEEQWSAGGYQGTGHITRWYSQEAMTQIKTVHREDPRWNTELTNYSAQ